MYFRLPNVFITSYINEKEEEDQKKQEEQREVFTLPSQLAEEIHDQDQGSFERKERRAEEVVRWALGQCPGRVVVSTSFGVQSAVMLHLISRVDKSIPVIWIDTGYLPPETYRYAAQLKSLFDLNVQIYQSDISPAHMEAIHGKLWEKSEPNAHRLYGLLRKVMPMRKAQKDLGASLMLTGLRRSQTNHRKTMSVYTPAANENECGKVCPILMFSDEDTSRYFEKYDLPQHPLVAEGYTTVGDAHSSRPRLSTDTSDRSTRFGKSKQQECGLHTESGSLEEYNQMIANAMKKSATDDNDDSMLPVHTLPRGYIVFGRASCKYCRAAKALLTAKGYHYTEYLVVKPGEESSEEGTREVLTLAQLVQLVREVTEDPDKVISTVPQVFLDQGYIGGFTDLCSSLSVSETESDSILESVVENDENKVAQNTSVPKVLVGCEAGLPKEMAELYCGRI